MGAIQFIGAANSPLDISFFIVAHRNLYLGSVTYKSMVDDINSGTTGNSNGSLVQVIVGGGGGSSFAKTDAAVDLDGDGAKDDSVIVITTEVLQTNNYVTQSGANAIMSIERLLAHEIAHAWQRSIGLPTQGAANKTREWEAIKKENDSLFDYAPKEPPRKYDPTHNDDPAGTAAPRQQGQGNGIHNSDPSDPSGGTSPVNPSNPPTYTPPASGPSPFGDWDPSNPQNDPPPPRTWLGFISDVFNYILEVLGFASPLILDLDNSGSIELESIENSSAFFDVDGDGFREETGWISVTSGDGFLVLDWNGDGVINDSSEWFGSDIEEGFSELSELDSNLDDVIDSLDEQWGNLQLWVDANGDGFSQENELHSLASYGVASINVSNTRIDQTVAGNILTNESTFSYSGGGSGKIVDAWFSLGDVNTVYGEAYVPDARTGILPEIRGYGLVADLRISMSIDNSTGGSLERVYDLLIDPSVEGGMFSVNEMYYSFETIITSTTLADDMRSIMHRWAGVDVVSSTSRGDYVDARDLEFLEAFTGQPFRQHGYRENPLWDAGQALTEAFHDALIAVSARLLLQTSGAEFFTNDISYDLLTDTFTDPGAIDSTALSDVQTWATNAVDALPIWQNVLRLVIGARGGEANLTGGDISSLDAAIYASDNTLDFDTVRDSIFPSSIDGVETDGDASANTISGTSNDDILDGKEGNDTVTGGDGKDTLYGDDGDDTLTGGLDDDLIFGGDGDDTFVYNLGDGFDVYRESLESETDDRILFGSGITSGDLSFTRLSNNDLQIDINVVGNEGTIVIENQFNPTTSLGFIETIEFYDTSTLDLTAVNHTFTATDQKEILYGVNNGSGGIVDTIYGEGGNDQITGYFGADTLYGGDGDDTM